MPEKYLIVENNVARFSTFLYISGAGKRIYLENAMGKEQPRRRNRPPTEAEMLSLFKQGFSFPPLRIEVRESFPRIGLPQSREADAILQATWEKETFDFVAEFKSRSRPFVFQEAVRQAEAAAAGKPLHPMVVLPFLNSRQLDELLQRGISGVDLSGNGIVAIQERILVYRTGMKNKYPESVPTKYAYRGTTSLVARAFLCRPQYNSLAEIDEEIRRRGGSVATSTISKALKRMEEDLIVEREDGVTRLLQADKLLGNLVSSYRPPKVRRQTTVQCKKSLKELTQSTPPNLKLVLSGNSSVDAYAVMGRNDQPVLYTDSINRLMDAWGSSAEETSRFADLELLETDDSTVFFDARSRNGIPYASPIQAYVECKTGDKREKEAADQVSRSILDDLAN